MSILRKIIIFQESYRNYLVYESLMNIWGGGGGHSPNHAFPFINHTLKTQEGLFRFLNWGGLGMD